MGIGEKVTDAVFPHAGAGSNVAASRVPVNVCDAIVVGRSHKLQICREIFITFRALAFEVEIPEIEVETLLGMNGGNNDKATFRGPIDGIAVLLVNGADVLVVAHSGAFDLLGAEEGYGRFGWDGSGSDHFGGRDEHESVAFRFPGEVNDGIFDRVDDFDGDAFLSHSKDFEICSE